MSSSIDTIGIKLQTLEERLQAENDSRMVFPPQMSAPPRQTLPTRPQHCKELKKILFFTYFK